ncbi:uncharacterized protein AMSG_11744 [Thecamonas trahens ATCC 50062]|uniref:Guanylate cyclase domain-containing protein n=1 Tax=Thecamonas trahens ATCC 50062 TaxID=461836 RepID=A0A0L0D5T7_THETB|nr:hypothetical protein AMSG_11744 [Thecamonas trahens ATCC 50062]KNC46668.1 hypothetical protein AMSG_11744 [Thecamonas trahens ATCC 50062]|eukprot:XP_013760493.1 hypothetical protein AMSG_11744 [Thecamonas trahens ATCC 50062]
MGSVVDACGVCNGTGDCVVSCNATLGPEFVFDCAGVCGGTALVDACGMCTGGSTGITPNVFLDACGVCFGGNAGLDSCGVCGGLNADKDACQICYGENAALDACGICFGSGRFVDACGVCFGNSSSCAGCDMVPNSGLELDACGVCGGQSTCTSTDSDAAKRRKQFSILVTGVSAVSAVVLALCLAALLRCKRQHSRRKYVAMRKASQAAIAPSGRVAILISDVQSSTMLWESYSSDMMVAIEEHDRIFRQALDKFRGYVIRTEGDSYVVAFQDTEDALNAAVQIQHDLMDALWPPAILHDKRLPSDARDSPDALWHGLRVRMGIAVCQPTLTFDERTLRFTYSGQAMAYAQTVGDSGTGGQVVVDAEVAAIAPNRVDRLGVFADALSHRFELFQARLGKLSGRKYNKKLRGLTRADP